MQLFLLTLSSEKWTKPSTNCKKCPALLPASDGERVRTAWACLEHDNRAECRQQSTPGDASSRTWPEQTHPRAPGSPLSSDPAPQETLERGRESLPAHHPAPQEALERVGESPSSTDPVLQQTSETWLTRHIYLP